MSLRAELQSIYDQHGELTPRLVLDAARRDPDGALHSHVFNCDPAVAADRYYLNRCGELIRKIKVRRVPDSRETGQPVKVRAYHSIPTTTGRVYKAAGEVATDPFTKQLLLTEMERDWRQLRARWEHFTEFAAMIQRDMGGGEAA